MKSAPCLFHPFRASALFVLCAFPTAGLAAKNDPQTAPTIWPVAQGHRTISSPAVERTLAQDEVWSGDTPRHQILDTGGVTRTVTLAPIGANGIPVDARYVARVSTTAGNRILFRRSDGELLAFWGSEESSQTQWVVLTAKEDGWDTRVSDGRSLGHDDPQLAYLGADVEESGDFVRPASARTNGYAIRFETNATIVYIACRASHPRFRIVVDGELAADVDIAGNSGRRLLVPVDLETSASKQIEILADELEFASVEIPDARGRLAAWRDAVPPVRMLWIGDSSTEAGARAYPWLAAGLLNYEVWSRSWGRGAQHVIGGDRNAPPFDAIEEDVAAVNPDIIVIGGHFFDDQLETKDYAVVVGAWFDAIERAARPDAVKIALPAPVNHGRVDRATDRRAAILSKEARRRDFHYINWQEWIEGSRDDPSSGNAHEVVAADGICYTPLGNAYLAGRLAEQIQRPSLERRIQLASVKRHQAGNSARTIASADGSR